MMNKTCRNKISLLILGLCAALALSGCAENLQYSPDSDSEVTTLFSEGRKNIWDTALPATEDISAEYEFVCNPYAMTAARRTDVGEDTYNEYVALCDAVIAGNTEVRLTAAKADILISALYECFPPSALIKTLVYTPDQPVTEKDETEEEEQPEETAPDENAQALTGGVLTITYQYGADEHTAKIEEFFRRTAKIMSDCGVPGSDSNLLTAIALYTYAAGMIEDVSGSSVSAFDAVMGKTIGDDSICACGGSFAALYEYLLLQAGIECTNITGTLYGSPRVWCALKLNENWYFADPGAEMTDTGGVGLMYFGMNLADITSMGYSSEYSSSASDVPLSVYTPLNAWPAPESFVPECSDGSFSVFRQSDFYEINQDGRKIIVYYSGSSESGSYGY